MGTFYYELTYPEAVLSICHNLGKWKGKKKKNTKEGKKDNRHNSWTANKINIHFGGLYFTTFRKIKWNYFVSGF